MIQGRDRSALLGRLVTGLLIAEFVAISTFYIVVFVFVDRGIDAKTLSP